MLEAARRWVGAGGGGEHSTDNPNRRWVLHADGVQHVRHAVISRRHKNVFFGTADRMRPGVLRSYAFPLAENPTEY